MGDLDGAIQALVEGDHDEIGRYLVYCVIHHFGGAELGRSGLPKV